MGYFYWLCVKNPNRLHTEISLGYLKDTKFYLESKASFIHISCVASFKTFLIAWLWEFCTFSVSSVVSLKPSSWPKYTQFFFFKYVFYLTALSKYLKKKSGVTVLVKEKRSIYFAIEPNLREISYVLYVHALMCAR